MGHHTLPLSLGLWLLQHTELPKDSHKPERNVLTELPRDIPKVSRTKNKDQKMIQELNQRPLLGPTKHMSCRVEALELHQFHVLLLMLVGLS